MAPSAAGPPAQAHSPDRGAQRARRLAAATVLACYLLVVLGDTVRVTDSGMGCSSWPLCNGHVGLSGAYQALLEQSHRYAAAIVTAFTLATFLVLRPLRGRYRMGWLSMLAAVALIGVQVLLGAITVFAHNAGWTVALHLACAWLVLAAVTVAVTSLLLEPATARAAGMPSRALVGAATAAVFVLSVSGMLTLHEGASGACRTWPLCLGSVAPLRLVALQYTHRLLGVVAAATVVLCAVRLWRAKPVHPFHRVAAGVVLALLAATAALGGVVASMGATETAQDLHLALASALWVAVVAVTVLAAPAIAAPPGLTGMRRAAARTGAVRV